MEREKKPSTRQESNLQPRGFALQALQFFYNPCLDKLKKPEGRGSSLKNFANDSFSSKFLYL